MNTPDMLSLSSVNEKPRAPAKVDVEPTKQERRTLDAYIQRGKTERFSLVLNVTPGLAAAMLVHNIGNRPITEKQVAKHVDRLNRGEFILHHHGISFANTGALNDGQHRLTAIARSGVSGQLQITFGAERAEFGVIDQGHARTSGHILGISGYKNATAHAALARALVLITDSQLAASDPQYVSDYAMTLRQDVVDAAIHMGLKHVKIIGPTPITLAYYWIATRSSNAVKLPAFFAGIATGESLMHPKLKLRNWIVEPHDSNRRRGGRQIVQVATVIINAWNAWLTGRKTFVVEWDGRASLPEPK